MQKFVFPSIISEFLLHMGKLKYFLSTNNTSNENKYPAIVDFFSCFASCILSAPVGRTAEFLKELARYIDLFYTMPSDYICPGCRDSISLSSMTGVSGVSVLQI